MSGKLNWGYDYDNKVWRPLKVNSEGQMSIKAIVDYLDDIGDVNSPSPTDGYVLTWDAATSMWIASAPAVGVTDHGALTGLADDDHPQYVLDTDLATHEADASTHGVTVIDGVDERNAAIAAIELDDLADVNAPTPADEDVLTWNAATSKWIEAAIPAGGPTIVRKTANEIVNNSTTLQDDDHLKLTMAANEIWLVEVFVMGLLADGSADWKVGWSYPAGATIRWGTAHYWDNYSLTLVALKETDSLTLYGPYTPDSSIFRITALVQNGSNPGTVNWMWAQNTAKVANNTIYANSCLIAHKIA